jgi:hypothetical protein
MSANLALISFADLQEISRKKRRSAVERWLNAEQIPFKRDGRRNPFTTVDAFNRSVYSPETAPRQEINLNAFRELKRKSAS